ncbi:hypothetical protein B0H11DRAFT_2233807 [Mycena galericulata]|nr:hypothetical protein B0H11DRAFT_2233807 [Mycena galericulata]
MHTAPIPGYKAHKVTETSNHSTNHPSIITMKLLAILIPFMAAAVAMALPISDLQSIADKRNCGLPCTCPDLSCLGPNDGGPA